MDEDGFNLLEGSMEKNTEEYFGMKKVKYIILVAVAGILIFAVIGLYLHHILTGMLFLGK